MKNTSIRIARWDVEVDLAETRKAYAVSEIGTQCDCYNCQNFERLGKDVFPQAYHQILENLGIDYRKPASLTQYTRLDTGLHLYSGFYHFIGRIVSGDDSHLPSDQTYGVWTNKTEPITEDSRIGFSDRADLAQDSLEGHPLVQLDIELKLPWVIEEFESD